ncbi:hypothetical protein GCM10009801_49610 [Streptomyces albiaxialis]|uniref:Secreted protein n=1 Tax=Streptomyces albiaxialis TaxID=329523 RepID=A0ABP5HU29_9ACTN
MSAEPSSSPAPAAPSRAPRGPRGLALYALIVCVLAVVAAVVSFLHGSWLGVVWILLAGLTSNMAWYYLKKSRIARLSSPE